MEIPVEPYVTIAKAGSIKSTAVNGRTLGSRFIASSLDAINRPLLDRSLRRLTEMSSMINNGIQSPGGCENLRQICGKSRIKTHCFWELSQDLWALLNLFEFHLVSTRAQSLNDFQSQLPSGRLSHRSRLSSQEIVKGQQCIMGQSPEN
ncbi:hypothetical protein UY3_17457 [Chelonia mydas]|uniref:Uncharacterized protein n=1 Tax=Chelonia mydas TaxID=8469 RepID=M7BB74_CHEMY|nr:hypothetical protein UY3_17457 [Chelonia mydas]